MALCNSHVIPEFFFSHLYDETHRYYAISNAEGQSTLLLQKGVREQLLCKDCESQFSSYEGHAKCALYDGTGIKVEDLGSGFRLSGIDYLKFKLFLMSLLWRLGITTLPYFRGVSLGQRHQERLRTMLASGNAGEPWEYGCIITRLEHEGALFRDLISPPIWNKIEGHRVYRLAIAGFLFAYFVSNHEADLVAEGFLQKSGEIVVPREEVTDVQFLMEMGVEVAKVKRGKSLPGPQKLT